MRTCLTLAMIAAWTAAAAVAPAQRRIETGIVRPNLARFERVQWQASDGMPPAYDAGQVLNGEACDAGGGNGYWAGRGGSFPVTLELTFPEPRKIDCNVIVWYTADIRGSDYRLDGLTPEGEWVALYVVRGNVWRDAVHRFAARTVSKVRFSLTRAAGQNRVVMREFLLYGGLSGEEETVLLGNVANCLGPNERGRLEDLGVAVKAVTYGNSQAVVAPAPAGGRPIVYTSYYNTGGAELLGYDFRSQAAYRYALPAGNGGYGLAAGADGRVYVGTVEGGSLIQFDPATEKLRVLGTADESVLYVWACAAGPDGRVYGAGYPKCVALVYDVHAATLSSPGSLTPREGCDYLRSVAVDARGRAWYGVGSKAALLIYDPADGSHRDVLPAAYAGNSTVYALVRTPGRVCAGVLMAGVTLVFDENTGALLREVPSPDDDMAFLPGVADTRGNVYGQSWPNQHLCVLKPEADTVEVLVPFLGAPKALLEDRFLYLSWGDLHRFYDLREGRVVDEGTWIQPRSGMSIYTLAQGPGGAIYGSTYINQRFFRYDPEFGRIEDLGRIIRAGGQCDSMAGSRDGKRLWMGSYTCAHLSVYDPEEPHKLGPAPDGNPADYGPAGQGQYRTRAIVEGPDGRVYVGTVPAYNSAPTGALVILDPATGTREVRTDIVPDGAVHCLAADESYVFGAGGGSVFALEPGTLRKVRERRLAATAMVSLPDGTLAVAAETNVVGLDPRTFESRWEAAFASHPKLTRLHRLAVGGSSLFGASDSGIYLVDASRSRLVQLTQLGTRHLAADQQGRLYFSAGDSLYRYDPRGDVEPAQTAPASDAIPFYEDKFDLLKWKDAEGRLRPVENAGDWARRRAHILAGMQQVMGPLPGPERQVAPDIRVLSEETLGTVIRKKITYAAEPNDRVPAYLLIPQQIQGRVPAVLCLHQTFRGGKDEPAGLDGSQDLWYALELARRGYVTLAPDYMPLGENRSDPYALGYQSTTMKGIWNHMAAVDLLASLPEVDAGRIGCAGHSLGGHNALFLAAFDTRIKVAVSSCGFDSFRDYMGGNLRGWSQRAYYMPRIAEVFGGDPGRLPFDWPEVLAAIAPRAAFVNAPLHDGNFRVASVRRCLEAAARVYDLLGAPDALQAVHPEAAHGFPVSARRAAWSVLDRVLGGGAPR